MHEVTKLLDQIGSGDPKASSQMLPAVYEELRRLAKSRMANERAGHTLQTTGLVHEAYIRLVDTAQIQRWDSKGHFFAAASEAMRRILVEHARQRSTQRRGGDFQRVEVGDIAEGMVNPSAVHPSTVLEISEAIDRVAQQDAQSAELVKLHCFGGFSIPDAAELLQIPRSSAYVHWAFAKALISRILEEDSC